MELFWKATASVLITIILIMSLKKQGPDIAVLLSITVCCMIGIGLIQLLQPLMDFLYSLQDLAYMNGSILRSLYKLLGISLISEIAATVCADAGCTSLGKSLQILGATTTLYLSIPVLQMFVTLVQDILEGL